MVMVAAAIVAGRGLPAQQISASTSGVFRQFAGHVYKVQVVETGSAAKASFGSGFLVTPAGHLVTNFHVISSLINKPDRYRVEVIDSGGKAWPGKILAIDVVHDLAILGTDLHHRPFLGIAPTTVEQGSRLFSMGNPRDLGLSIVEGTYNGLMLHTLYPRVHLTASINPGMSGGPTIDQNGHVIGVNVSTAGNQMSFLVPVNRVAELLKIAMAPPEAGKAPSLKLVGEQLRAYQSDYLRPMFDSGSKTVAFGPFRLPTQPADFFRCWGDRLTERDKPYERSVHTCDTDSDIYLDGEQTTGTVSLNHELITTKEMNAAQFYSLYAQRFAEDMAPVGESEYVTNWNCHSRNVRNGTMAMRVGQCVRRYRQLGELYDSYMKIAVLGRSNVGVISTFSMTGVTFENLNKLSERYLRQITWR